MRPSRRVRQAATSAGSPETHREGTCKPAIAPAGRREKPAFRTRTVNCLALSFRVLIFAQLR